MVDVKTEKLRKEFDVGSGVEVAVDSVDINIFDGEFVTVVGPSGCGKTTLLRMVAGLERTTSGEIYFGDREVTDLPPQDRDLAMVFQNVSLFPFKTVRENIMYGMKYTDIDKEMQKEKVESTTELLGIHDMLDKKPNQLSGGQRQRVAIARALVREPVLFLFDEPMSDLDAKLKIEMRAELKELHKNHDLTVLYVTHDQEEAITLSDRVIVINDGSIQQQAPPHELYNEPNNLFVAKFIGSPTINTIKATLDDSNRLQTPQFEIELPDSLVETIQENHSTNDIVFAIRPADLYLAESESEAHISGSVKIYEQMGDYTLLYLTVPGFEDEIKAKVPPSEIPDPGDTYHLRCSLDRSHLFDKNSGQNITHSISSPRVKPEVE